MTNTVTFDGSGIKTIVDGNAGDTDILLRGPWIFDENLDPAPFRFYHTTESSQDYWVFSTGYGLSFNKVDSLWMTNIFTLNASGFWQGQFEAEDMDGIFHNLQFLNDATTEALVSNPIVDGLDANRYLIFMSEGKTEFNHSQISASFNLDTSFGYALSGTKYDDVITTGSGDDDIDGQAGNDIMTGGLGDDWYAVDSYSDIVVEEADGGWDAIVTRNLNIYSIASFINVEGLFFDGLDPGINATLTGNATYNYIVGGPRNDLIDGGLNGDTMLGGDGNDTYVVDSALDVVTELVNEGTDTIRTSLSTYSLASRNNVENLTFTGSGNSTLTGNALNNVLTAVESGYGNDYLDGGAGNDTMVGGRGNDTYVVDSALDVVTELVKGGTDTIRTSLSTYSLASRNNVENLTFTGSGNSTLRGNELANLITVESGYGNDYLNGGEGNDELIRWFG